MAILSPGTQAPNFTLNSTPTKKVSLSDFKGQPVVIVFYPADWSSVCSNQLALYNELIPEFQKYNAKLLGISVDSAWSHSAFEKELHLEFPLLSDFEPKGKVANEFGVYRPKEGTSERALFVLDPNGVVKWSYVSPIKANPGAEGILKALEQL